MENIYTDGTYWKNNPNYHINDSYWKARHLISILDSVTSSKLLKQRMYICDVGCGSGAVLSYFVEFMNERGIDCHGTGYDISSTAIHRARLLFPQIHFAVKDVTQIIRNFDLLLLIDILEHLTDPNAMLSHCFEISPIVLVHLPLDYHYWGMLDRGKNYFDYLKRDRGHIHYYRKETAFKLITAAQGRVIAWKYTRWGIEQDFDRSRSGRLIKFFRHIGFRLNMDYSVRLLGGASIAMICKRI